MAAFMRRFESETYALLPVNNGGEMAALYCFVFLYIACQGPGMWSIDDNR